MAIKKFNNNVLYHQFYIMKLIYIVIFLIVVSILFIIIFGSKKFPFYSFYATRKNQFEKKQWIRLLDILILGPFALWLGYKLQTDNCKSWSIIPYLLYIYAFGTIVYNFSNYYQNLKNTI
ncbi:hypothetical protein H012_gp721 [Acanthamoeba polyphaga moumouvirus]|uniref:Uncharacterized protein n=2 Tax=Moumouvirus TaxID=3080801 RepID=L7RBB0_9VIRU|nr:hypothetical protein H012_gp721 [Acanthamoeba polyphaga moumouvirus]AEX63082.1 hypothetical protein mv_R880 [Moumouvirus Monve]AGC01744.1 hypothetical protein Moumou_00200 [Acanthamoeba polyphaga moumouvirus]AQN68090.1 hypothetical protein [Saudi moumouvirus]